MEIHKLGISLCLLFAVGCTSVSSTVLNRTDGDAFYGSSNGDPGPNGHARPFKGIPMTVRVPTHVDITIKEKILLRVTDSDVVYLKAPKRHLSVDSNIIYTEKVFTVDPKRPGGGDLDYNIGFGAKNENFDNTQYFKSIGSKVTDTTIKDITTAIANVTEAISTSSNTKQKDGIAGNVIVKHRTVAWRRFDVDAPDFELQIQCFVEQHMNNCNSCDSYQSPQSESLIGAASVLPPDGSFINDGYSAPPAAPPAAPPSIDLPIHAPIHPPADAPVIFDAD